jgi:hypothetical protein
MFVAMRLKYNSDAVHSGCSDLEPRAIVIQMAGSGGAAAAGPAQEWAMAPPNACS